MTSLNFTQFCGSVDLCCDYDVLDHATLSPSGHCSARARKQQETAMLERIASNKQAHALYDAAVLSGDVMDPSGKVTQAGLLAEIERQRQIKINGRLAQINTQIRMLESVGIGKKGTIRPSYQKQIDELNNEKVNLFNERID